MKKKPKLYLLLTLAGVAVAFMGIGVAAGYSAASQTAYPPNTPAYMLSSAGGVVAAFPYPPHDEAAPFCETCALQHTARTITALPPEEQARLAAGIPLYSEEQLVRALQDFGS